jgi:hypothetical protein
MNSSCKETAVKCPKCSGSNFDIVDHYSWLDSYMYSIYCYDCEAGSEIDTL